MKLKRKVAGLLSIVMLLVMVMPLTVLADSEVEYEDVVFMTEQEVEAILIDNGVNLDKEVSVRAASLVSTYLYIQPERSNGRIAVVYYTEATMVANEIGIKYLDLYEGSTQIVNDYKDYYGFKQSYLGGFYYTAPKSGKKYYAEGTNYAIFTASSSSTNNVSLTITY